MRRPLRFPSNPVFGVLMAVPLLLYAFVFRQYAVNVPKWDDHALKFFLLKFSEEQTLTGKIYQLFRQHNEHRIVLDRFVSWLDYTLFGKLNYVHLMTVGNLALAGLLFVFVRAIQKGTADRAAGWLVLPLPWLLFNLSQWENMFWGMAALQNFAVVTLVMATIYVLAFREQVGWLAIMLAILASCTSGNGLMVWPVGLLLLLVRQSFSGVIRWLIAGAIIIRLYFLGYAKPPGNPAPKGSLFEMVQGWLAFNGSAFEAFPMSQNFLICLLGGTLLTVVTAGLALYQTIRYLRGSDRSPWTLFFGGSVAFLLGTGLIVAQSRVGFGLETLITSRYKVYSLTLMALLYCFFITHTALNRRQLVAASGLAFSVLLAFHSYSTFLDETIQLRKMLLTDQFNWTYTDNTLTDQTDPTTRQLIDNAPAFYDPCLNSLRQPVQTSAVVPPDTLFRTGQDVVIRQDSFPPLGVRDEGVYVLARSDRRTYLFPARQNVALSRFGWLSPGRLIRPGIQAQLTPDAAMQTGHYALYWLVINPDSNCRIYPMGRTLTSTGQASSLPPQNW